MKFLLKKNKEKVKENKSVSFCLAWKIINLNIRAHFIFSLWDTKGGDFAHQPWLPSWEASLSSFCPSDQWLGMKVRFLSKSQIHCGCGINSMGTCGINGWTAFLQEGNQKHKVFSAVFSHATSPLPFFFLPHQAETVDEARGTGLQSQITWLWFWGLFTSLSTFSSYQWSRNNSTTLN